MVRRNIISVVTMALLGLATARADIIFDNGESVNSGGLLSTVDTHYISADDFVLQDGFDVLTDIHWWGYYAEDTVPATDSFTAYIYADNGGAPGAVLYTLTDSVVRVDSGNQVFGDYTEYAYEMDISALDLDYGTTYWLAIQNDVDCNWFWSVSDFAEGDAHQKLEKWTDYHVEEAYYLTGPSAPVMPEPATFLLMGIGMSTLALSRTMSAIRKNKTK